MLSVLIILMSIVASFAVVSLGQGVAPGSYWLSFGGFASVTDLLVRLGKAAVFGYVVAVIACHRDSKRRAARKAWPTASMPPWFSAWTRYVERLWDPSNLSVVNCVSW